MKVMVVCVAVERGDVIGWRCSVCR